MSSENWLDEDEASCHVLLQADASTPLNLLSRIPHLAGVVLPQDTANLQDWRKAAHGAGIAFLVETGLNAEKNAAFSADGAIVQGVKALKEMRKNLGEGPLIGCSLDLNRHEAMNAGELGADFLSLGSIHEPISDALTDFCAWWCDVTVLPLAVAGVFDERQCRAAMDAGAAFLLLDAAALDERTLTSLEGLFS